MIVLPSEALALGWTAVHLAWQAALVGLLCGALYRFGGLSAAARYRLGSLALATVAVLGAIDYSAAVGFLETVKSPPPRPSMTAGHEGQPATAPSAAAAAQSPQAPLARRGEPLVPPLWVGMAGTLWAALALVLLARVGGGWWVLRQTVRRSREVDAATRSTLERALPQLGWPGLRRVRLLASREVSIPMAAGTLSRAIVLPAEMLSSLVPAQIAPVLAHELAHHRRGDFAANTLQLLLEAILLRHPSVVALSDRVRADRERCCDELAAYWLGSRRRLAHGLASLEFARCNPPALAANHGNLVHRIERLLRPGTGGHGGLRGVVALALISVVAAGAGLAASATPLPVPRRMLHAQIGAAGPPRLVLGGLDPVSLLLGNRSSGREDLERRYEGYLYRFASSASRDTFDQEPGRYAVVNGLICPVTGADVEPDLFRVVEGRIYLFCCPNSLTLSTELLEQLTGHASHPTGRRALGSRRS